MKYKSICAVCGAETPRQNDIIDHVYKKYECGFIEVKITWSMSWQGTKYLDFCSRCARKPYTIEEIKQLSKPSKEQSY